MRNLRMGVSEQEMGRQIRAYDVRNEKVVVEDDGDDDELTKRGEWRGA